MTEQTIQELEAQVREAQAALVAARETAAQARTAARAIQLTDATTRIIKAGEDEFFATFPDHDVRPYILPFGREYGKWNPKDVDNAAFGKGWLAGMFAMICKRTDQVRTRPSRLIFSSGSFPAESDKIGQEFTARHDQTGAFLGEYQIVGLVMYDQEGNVARVVGDVPDVKYSQNTYK